MERERAQDVGYSVLHTLVQQPAVAHMLRREHARSATTHRCLPACLPIENRRHRRHGRMRDYATGSNTIAVFTAPADHNLLLLHRPVKMNADSFGGGFLIANL